MTTANSGIKIESFGTETMISLPTRPPSASRFIGCLPLFFSLAAIGIGWFIFQSVMAPQPAPPFGPIPVEAPAPPPPAPPQTAFYIVAGIIAVPLALLDLVFIIAGLKLLLPTSMVIRVTQGELLLITKAGAFTKTQRRELADVKQIRITDKYPGLQFSSGANEPSRSSFIVDCKADAMLVVAAGYYQSVVIEAAGALADDFRRRNLAVAGPEGGVPVAAPASPPEDVSADSPAAASPPAAALPVGQPAGSKITFLAAPDSLTFLIPRNGIHGPALVLLIFSAIWLFVSGCIGMAFIASFIGHPGLSGAFAALFLLLFMAVGVGVFLLFLQMAFRRAVIVATRDALILTQKAPIKDREFSWVPGEIQTVKTDFSGTRVNERQFRELRIISTDGRHPGFFDGRDDDELEWMAGAIRNFYGLA